MTEEIKASIEDRTVGIYRLISVVKPSAPLIAAELVASATAEPKIWFCSDEGVDIILYDGIYIVGKNGKYESYNNREDTIAALIFL